MSKRFIKVTDETGNVIYEGEENREPFSKMQPTIEPTIAADHVEFGWIKKIIVGAIVLLLTNFAAGIWWAATISANMNFLRQEISRLSNEVKDGTADRYKGADAQKDFKAVYDRIYVNESRITRLEERKFENPIRNS